MTGLIDIKKNNSDTANLLDNYWIITLEDGKTLREQDYSWSSFSELKSVKYRGGNKTVYVSKLKIGKIEIIFNYMATLIEVPSDCEVYQASRQETVYQNGTTKTKCIGRIVGLIKDNEVIEERFLDGRLNEIIGFKK